MGRIRRAANFARHRQRRAPRTACTPHRLHPARRLRGGAGDTLFFRARLAIPLSKRRERSRLVLAPDNLSRVRGQAGAWRGLRAEGCGVGGEAGRGGARRRARPCSPVAGALDGLPLRVEVSQNVGAHLLRVDCRAWGVCVRSVRLGERRGAGRVRGQEGGQAGSALLRSGRRP